MGVWRTTYCGAYAECKTARVKCTCTMRRCTNQYCPLRGEETCYKLCTCDCETEKIKVEKVEDVVSDYGVDEEVGNGLSLAFFSEYPEDLECKGIHIYLGDKKGTGYFVNEDVHSLVEIRPADIRAQMKQFAKVHERGFKKLRAAYGARNVKVKWGLVHTIDI
jgi:hypothetical protein